MSVCVQSRVILNLRLLFHHKLGSRRRESQIARVRRNERLVAARVQKHAEQPERNV